MESKSKMGSSARPAETPTAKETAETMTATATATATTEALFLEHINLNVPDEDAARTFYVDGLGGAVNPVATNHRQLHVNVGASQWHLLTKTKRVGIGGGGDGEGGGELRPVEAPQLWPGYIEVWTTESLEDVRLRLGDDRCRDDGGVDKEDEGLIRCRCPWGNAVVVLPAPSDFKPPGSHPGGRGTLVALARAVHPVRPGSAQKLVEFWTGTLGCSATLTAAAGDAIGPSCVVRFSSGQELLFVERDDAPPADAYDCDNDSSGYHICLYLPTDEAFERAFRETERRGLLYANPRFADGPPEFGNALNWEEAVNGGQFRVKDLRGEDGELGLALELEVRSTRHVSFPLSEKRTTKI